jgi:PQQ-dependent catabolism-associated beta-propeller protein
MSLKQRVIMEKTMKNNLLSFYALRFYHYLIPTRCVGIHADRAAVCSTRRVDTAFLCCVWEREKLEHDCQSFKGLAVIKPVSLLLGLALLTVLTTVVQAETVFVSLEKDNALALVDPVEGKLIKTVPVGQRPRGIALSADNKFLFVATSDDNTIKMLDADTLKELAKLPSGKDPETFALSPAGDRLYVSNEDDSLVTVIDLTTKKAIQEIKVGVEPEGITVSPDNQWLISASETTNMVHWIDTKTNTIVENTLVDPRPRAVNFTADSQQLWVTSEMAGTVMVLNVKTKQPIKTIKLAVDGVTFDKIQPVGVVIDKDRKRAYIALGPANRVAVINAQTYEIEKVLLVGQRVWNLAFSPDQKRLYTTNGTSNDISIIDLDTQTVTKSIGVGTYPWGVAVKP